LDLPHQTVHTSTQLAYDISRGDWINEPHKLAEIIKHMQICEDASNLVMKYIDEMVVEKNSKS